MAERCVVEAGWRLAGLPLELQLELLAAHHLAVAAHSLATCVFGFFSFLHSNASHPPRTACSFPPFIPLLSSTLVTLAPGPQILVARLLI